MAQPMMHLLIADKIYEKFSSIHSYGVIQYGSVDLVGNRFKAFYTSQISCFTPRWRSHKTHIAYFDTFINA